MRLPVVDGWGCIDTLTVEIVIEAGNHSRAFDRKIERQQARAMMILFTKFFLAHPRHNEVDRMDFLALKLQRVLTEDGDYRPIRRKSPYNHCLQAKTVTYIARKAKIDRYHLKRTKHLDGHI